MKYLTKTSELLFEPSFLKFARQAYEGFYSLDEARYQAALGAGQQFDLSINAWHIKCNNDTEKRSFSGYNAPFRVYAGQEAQEIIREDWDEFNISIRDLPDRAKDEATREFLQEANEVNETIPHRPYLEPIQKWMKETLDSISKHYEHINVSTRGKKGMNTTEKVNTKLKWRADASVLCALFLDLREQKLVDGARLLAVGDDELAKFIFDNFEFLSSDNSVIDKEESSIKRYIKGKTIAKRIKIDFSSLKM